MINVSTELVLFPVLNLGHLALTIPSDTWYGTISYVQCFMVISADIIASSLEQRSPAKEPECLQKPSLAVGLGITVKALFCARFILEMGVWMQELTDSRRHSHGANKS